MSHMDCIPPRKGDLKELDEGQLRLSTVQCMNWGHRILSRLKTRRLLWDVEPQPSAG